MIKAGINKSILLIILLSTLFRLFLATQLELGNDEVYYWTYALYPDWSHFDHPPMVGILAQIFSLNLYLTNDFFLRLGSIVLSACSTWIIFTIGREIRNEKTGLFAALLFTGSIYCSVISGFSLSPDAPLVFFWLLAIRVALKFLPQSVITSQGKKQVLLFGIFAGLAMLSKYQGVFLWVGVFLYVLLHNRKWLKEPSLYLAGLISLLVFSPVLFWNVRSAFISFAFHADRVTPSFEFNPLYLLSEIVGEIVYNNPINYVLIILALIAMWRGKYLLGSDHIKILLLMSVPLWLLFTGFSIVRATLPHWTGPAFISFILLAATYWSSEEGKGFKWAKSSTYSLAVLLVIALFLINYSPFQLGKKSDILNFGENDFTQDLYGWDQIGKAFKIISNREEAKGTMQQNSDLVSDKWFPGAHLDFYVARPSHRNLFLIGPLVDIHKYFWINQLRGNLIPGNNYYHIAVSNTYRDPNLIFKNLFEDIKLIDTVEIKRDGKTVRYAFFYLLKNYSDKSGSKTI